MINIEVAAGDIAQATTDVIIVNLFEGVSRPGGGTGAVDQALGRLISEELEKGKIFQGKCGQTLVLPTYGKLKARYVVVVGLGKAEEFKNFQLRRASAAAIRAAGKLKAASAATILHGAGLGGVEVKTAARLFTEGTLLGSYRFTQYKSKPKELTKDTNNEEGGEEIELTTLKIIEHDAGKIPEIEQGVQIGRVIAENVNLVRDWVFDSPNHVTPDFLKQQAESISGLTCAVLDSDQIKQLGMGAFTLVAQGSDEPPYLIHLSYRPPALLNGQTPSKKIALVGKGITFDSGGLSLKPAKSMELMKMDMAGAGAVIGTMKAIVELVRLGLPLNVQIDAFAPVCENMPSGHSSKPGDVIRAMNGKTIEINNTDAEGRLILCDALTYAQQQVNPDEIIDMATLTGACITALGKAASGIMGTSPELIQAIRNAGEAAGEKFWELPLYDDYKDALKSDVADLINSGSGGEAGSSAGGMFLKEFIDKGRAWVHLDIAGPAYTSKDQPEVPKGATGVCVRTLLYYLFGF